MLLTYKIQKELFHSKMYYYLERFYNYVGGEPYPHIDQFNLDLGQPLPPLFCFSFVYVFVCIF